MANFIFPNNQFLEKLTGLKQLNQLGTKPATHEVVTMIVVSQNWWEGYNAMFLLHEECEKFYGKRIDLTKLRYVVLKDLDAASKSPHLERAQFIIVLNEDLLGVENYPELEGILPFFQEEPQI